MKFPLFPVALLVLLASCTSNPGSNTSRTAEESPTSAEQSDVTRHQRVYYFQHRLIREWVFETDGAFFFNIYNLEVTRLFKAATEIVDPEYAQQLNVIPLYEDNAVLIEFPEPTAPANCFFALIQKQEDGFVYYTYEKTIDLGEEGVAGVVGGWDAEGNHQNYGPRSYRTGDAFVSDMLHGEGG